MTTLDLFENAEETIPCEAGMTIFLEGEEGDRMYLVVDGEVEITVGGEVVETAGPGTLVGEMAMIDASPRSATAIAKTDCRLVPIDEEHFIALVQETPSFAIHVMKVIADRLRRMDQRMS